MRAVVVIALALVAACASQESIRRSEPIWTAEHEVEFKPFTQCLWQAVQGEVTVNLVYEGPKATLSAYSGAAITFLYEITVHERGKMAYTEMRFGPSLARDEIAAETRVTAERCASQI